MEGRRREYFSYLVRIWWSDRGAGETWRASVECPLTGARRGFASLKDLFAFLEAVTRQAAQERSDNEPEEGETSDAA
jgi:hypothetical protein